MNSFARISILVLVCTAAACTASYPTAPTSAKPLALVLQLAVPRGKVVPGTTAANTYTFNAFTITSDNVYEAVTAKATWVSSDPGVVQVRAPGTFNAVAPGAATAIVRYEGLEATADMVVVDPVVLARLLPRLEVSASTAPRLGGGSVRATASRRRVFNAAGQVESVNVSNQVEWSSSDPGIASVDGNGMITPVSLGTVLITASMDGMSDWIWVSVLPAS